MANAYGTSKRGVVVVIDGEAMEQVISVKGGQQYKGNKAEIKNAVGTSPQFHSNQVSTEDCTIEIGISQSQKVLDWANQFIDSKHVRNKDIEISYVDEKKEVAGGVVLKDVLMTSFGISNFDGASKDFIKATCKFRATAIETIKKGGAAPQLVRKTSQKKAWANAFRAELGGFAMDGCTKVEGFTWNMKVEELRTGSARYAILCPTTVEGPSALKFTWNAQLGDARSAIEDWVKTFMEEGKAGSTNELAGAVTALDMDNIGELFTIEFKQFGVYEAPRGDVEAQASKIDEYSITGYCETCDIRSFAGASS